MFKKEQYNLEFKESLSITFLKTVSAYSNYNGGRVIFGINDSGEVVGVGSIKDFLLRIENMINDSIEPRPKYKVVEETIEGKIVIILDVFWGKDTPYYYKGKAYKRSDASTVPVDRLELNRLVLSGMNIDFEENISSNQELEFTVLEDKLKKIVGINALSIDILKTLNLYNKEGFYNIAGQLLSDTNDLALSGIDMVKFGDDINIIRHRETFEGISIISQFDKAIESFERDFQYEEVVNYSRIQKELVPKSAFREAIANAIVHRDWNINSHIQISMYKDRIEINSPGGLPPGMTEDAYLYGQNSNLRNPIIASVFNRLNIIEKFGTGVKRIKEAYATSYSKPIFQISANNINVILPLIENDLLDLTDDERKIYAILEKNKAVSRADIEVATDFEKTKALREIKLLLNKGIIKRIGSGPSTLYKIS